MEIIFTVIIPHRNTLDLLQRCLDSIPRRDDIQIIVVDDNSNESQVDFSWFLGLNDKHVEVYLTKEGKGAGYARNVGLLHAKGKWLLFADADDFFLENAFDCLFAQAASPHEIIYFKVIGCYSDTLGPVYRGEEMLNRLTDNFLRKKKYAEEELRYKWYSPWGKIIKRELVTRENIQFEEVSRANDVMFSVYIGYYAQYIDAVDCYIYCYTANKGSLTTPYKKEHLEEVYCARLRCNAFVRKHGKKYCQSSIMYFLISCLRYGLTTFRKFIGLAIRYKQNPLTGIHHWIFNAVRIYHLCRKNRKYVRCK